MERVRLAGDLVHLSRLVGARCGKMRGLDRNTTLAGAKGGLLLAWVARARGRHPARSGRGGRRSRSSGRRACEGGRAVPPGSARLTIPSAPPAAGASPLVELVDVERQFVRAGVRALDGVSLAVAAGEWLAVVGPSGSGKSTLLHLLCGVDRPTRGRVLFAGEEPGTAAAWTRLRARRIGFVFQFFHLLPTLSARENVEVPMFGQGRSAGVRRQRALELLALVGLADRAGHRPAELSGGERQRVAIARSLANDPELLLADEPTGNLDAAASAGILELLRELRRERHLTVVVATHSAAVAEQTERRVRLVKGRLLAEPEGT